jgi:LysR family transcriptional regulator, transcriptional activator of the cysJI operon
MDFHQLRVFLETAKEKSFSRAAENIFLSQPTVSTHIKALEKEVGTPLFDRSSRELELTEAGEILFGYARELLNMKEKAIIAIQKDAQIFKGHLEVAASSVPGAYLLPGLMLSFRAAYPEVTFSVLTRDTKQVIKSIKDYTYNIGFIGESVKDEEVEQVRLMEDELILITPPGICLNAEGEDSLPAVELSRCLELPFVLREPGSATRLAFERAIKKQLGRDEKLQVTAYMESQEAVKEAVQKGLGATVISIHAVKRELQAGIINGYRVKDLPMQRSFYVILRKKRALPPLAKMFLEFTLAYFNHREKDKGSI